MMPELGRCRASELPLAQSSCPVELGVQAHPTRNTG